MNEITERLTFIAHNLIDTKPRAEWADHYRELSEVFALLAAACKAGEALTPPRRQD